MLDPEDEGGHETDLETSTVPEVPDPTANLPDESDAPPELRTQFWVLVSVFNVALIALSVGVMLVGFLGDLRRGGALTVGGALLFLLGYRRYRRVTANPDRE